MNRPAAALEIPIADRDVLEGWSRSQTAPHRLVVRAKTILMASEGTANAQIAEELGVSRPTVIDWRARFERGGLDELTSIRPGRGRKPGISGRRVKEIVRATLHEKPEGATHWSCRTMATAKGVSRSTVQRSWDAHGLQPQRVETFKLSRDPQFVAKLTDIF